MKSGQQPTTASDRLKIIRSRDPVLLAASDRLHDANDLGVGDLL
jgi:hypothetical protein